MLLVSSHYVFFTLNIVHGDLVVFIQVLQLGLDPFLLLFELFLSGDELGRLLLELREDHRRLNHLLDPIREYFLIKFDFFLLDDERVGEVVVAWLESWQWHSRLGNILFLIMVFVPPSSLQTDNLVDQALHLGGAHELVDLDGGGVDGIELGLLVLGEVVRHRALSIGIIKALNLNDQLFVIVLERLGSLMYRCHRCLLLHLEAVVKLKL